MKNILVTGGAGYIGSHSLFPLINEGYTPIVYDNLSKGHRGAVKSAELIEADLADVEKLDSVFKKYEIDAVMHFASSCYVEESVRDPQKYFLNNLSNTLTLLKTMLSNKVKKIVFSSSCTVYGKPVSIPIKENHPKEPINPYGWSKHFIEQILAEYSRSYDLNYAVLRYFNAAGASSHEDIGEDHFPETHLIPCVLINALDRSEKLKVYGGDYGTHDGTCVRDYVHVEDIIGAHILSLKDIDGNGGSRIFNVGSGTGYTVREVITMAEKVTGEKIEFDVVERRDGDVEMLVASSEKINRQIGWSPKHFSLESIIKSAWEWYKKNPGGYKDNCMENK